MSAAPMLRLLDLDRPLGSVELPSGTTVPVRAIDGVGMQSLAAVDAAGALLLWDIAHRCIPEATRADVDALTLPMVQAILGIAAGGANAVMADVGNGSAPATGATSTPESATPSA